MPNYDDRAMAVAKVYATAMLKLAEASGDAAALGEELAELARFVESRPAFADFLANPTVESAERARILERALRGHASDLLVDALQVLNRKGRIGLLTTVAEAYRRAFASLRGRVEVRVTSAQALDEAQRQELRAAVRRSTGNEAVLAESVDAALIGGMIVQIGDSKADGSIVTKLRKLSEALLARASREIYSGAHVEY